MVWTATATGGLAGPLRYQFWVYQEGAGWSLGRDWSTSNTFNWTPAGGRYAVQVWVRSAGSTATYEHWLGTGFFEIQ